VKPVAERERGLPQTAGAAPARRPGRAAFALKLIVSVALMALLFSRIPAAEVGGLLSLARPGPIFLAVVLFVVSIAGSAFQWRLFLRALGVSLPFRTAFGFYLVGLFFNNFLPATLGGDVVKVIDVHRAGGSRSAAVVATLMDRAMGLLVLMIAGLLAVWIAGDTLPYPELRAALHVATLAIVLVFAAILSRRVLALCARTAERIPPGRPRDLAVRLLGLLGDFQADRRVFLLALPVSLGIQAIRIGVHYLAAVALGVALPPVLFLLVVPVIAVAMTLPVSVGGWGVREGVAVVLFGRFGVASSVTLAFEVLAHLVTMLVSAAGGLLFALRKRRA
jgi:uncharacterized protein (TIRG00374 family)